MTLTANVQAPSASVFGPGRVQRVAVVTGAAGDLGHGIAAAFLAQGMRVAALDLDADAVAARWPSLPDDLLCLACNVADEAQVEHAVQAVRGRYGRIDILVNNAAVVTASAKVGELQPADWRRALDVNLTGAWLMARACLPAMRAAGGGVILNVCSQLGHVAAPGRGAYGASKAGLLALTRALAVDHAAEGIRAVSLSPGAVLTSRVVGRYGSTQAATAALAGRYPTGRLGTLDEVVAAAEFLVSERASFVSGTDLLVDGGYTAV
ncbi:SDR family oxidoreductase [Verticiella sediminum]|uniref:SDR family oxidoreductase n=1 Tax=Verticiella sediminum TaxID=1247510 RepID=A0A556AIV9_9BURK|nr:SDR family oxidoreductase [Verticiella sediminum]TSH92811.1 SDR family oxidoreductase [Verticiella sediminum]